MAPVQCFSVVGILNDGLTAQAKRGLQRLNSTHLTETPEKMASKFGLVRAEMVPIGPNSTENAKATNAALALRFSVE
jgi:hypothetical protein